MTTSGRVPRKWASPMGWMFAVMVSFATLGQAQQATGWSSQLPDDATAAQRQFYAELDKLAWIKGPATVSLPGNADIQIPAGYVSLNAKDTLKFLELNENLGSGDEVLVGPDDLTWMAYLTYADEGYVKDDEKIDPDALLKSLQDSTAAANVERKKRGWEELHVTGWTVAPNYNATTQRLEWATRNKSASGEGSNFFTKILGRRGHTSVQMVASLDDLPAAEAALNDVLGGFNYGAGDRYADYKPGDKVAEYGLAALVVGGAAAVATKKGFFGVIAAFFAAAWKFIVVAMVAGLASLRKLFAKKE